MKKMKKSILVCFLLVCISVFSGTKKDYTNAFKFKSLYLKCDACGCSASGGSMGFSSMLDNNFVGLRYFKQSYTSKDGIFDNSPWIDENFNTVQAWARIPITNKIQISALIPYHFNERDLTSGTESIAGLGDITIIGLYSIYETHKDSTVFAHKINAGIGIKMPSGKFDEANNSGTVNQSFQLGTGSWDYQLVTEYVIKKKNLGLNSMLNYVFKTENEKKYQYGNQFNYSSTLFYLFETNNELKVVPQLGVAGEVYQSNKQHGIDLANTAGDILFGKFGIETGKNKFSIGANAMLPINQNLSGGKMKSNYRWSINLNYTL
jgi:hypothetical protein